MCMWVFPVSAALLWYFLWCGHICVQTHTLSALPEGLDRAHTRCIHLFLSPRCFEISVLSVLFSPQEYQIDIIFAQTWVDTRLRFNSSSSMRLTLNRYAGFTADKQLYYKFPYVSFSSWILISILYLTMFFKWTPRHCCDSSFPLQQLLCFHIFILWISHLRTIFFSLSGRGL